MSTISIGPSPAQHIANIFVAARSGQNVMEGAGACRGSIEPGLLGHAMKVICRKCRRTSHYPRFAATWNLAAQYREVLG